MSGNAQKDSDILCDMCTEEDRKPARKTCMKCEISMCVQHLQAHLTTPVLLQTHPLTEPMALGEDTKCPQHGKLLEYYCLDDMTLVCVSCAIEDQHRLHNMKTFSTAHQELVEKIRAEQQVLQEKSDDENVSLEKWEQSEREKLGRCSVRLIEAVTNLRDVSLTSIQSSVSARMVSIKTSKSSMQAAQKEKDTFRFLQMFSQVNQDVEKAKAVDLRKGLEPGSHRDKLVEEIRQKGEKMVKQTSGFIGSLLTLVDPENHQELTATGSDLIFEPQNLGPGISLSKDSRKVFYCDQTVQSSVHMFLIQSTLPRPDFSRWVIRLSKDSDWSVGICDKNYATNMKDGTAYGLRCHGNQLFSLTERGPRPLEETEASTCSQPPTVEVVFVSPDTLSFFSRIGPYQRVELLTVKMMYTNWSHVPFVCMEKDKPNNQKSEFAFNGFGTPSSFGQSSGGLFNSAANIQKQWKCSCGKVYSETTDGFHYGKRVYKKSSLETCSCGRVVGSPPTTEVLCELL